MRFIDYVALLLLNTVAGYFLIAGYLIKGLDDEDQKRWVPGFGIVGFISLLFGSIMVTTWPLPGPYNFAYGEMSVFFGAIFLTAALAIALGWNLSIIAYYAFFAGVASAIIGVGIINFKLTLSPVSSGLGFIFSGLGGIFAAPTLIYMRHNKPLRMIGGLVLIVAALIWAYTVYPEYYTHLKLFEKWTPSTMGIH